LLGFLIAGCPKDGCTSNDTRCFNGHPQVCGNSQNWTNVVDNCPPDSVCCRTLSPYSTPAEPRELYACVPAGVCLPNDTGEQRSNDAGN
jgi:hypothetical protein